MQRDTITPADLTPAARRTIETPYQRLVIVPAVAIEHALDQLTRLNALVALDLTPKGTPPMYTLLFEILDPPDPTPRKRYLFCNDDRHPRRVTGCESDPRPQPCRPAVTS